MKKLTIALLFLTGCASTPQTKYYNCAFREGDMVYAHVSGLFHSEQEADADAQKVADKLTAQGILPQVEVECNSHD